jgi:hypothetical protein
MPCVTPGRRSWQCHVSKVPAREASVNHRADKGSNAIRGVVCPTPRTVRFFEGSAIEEV